VFRRSHSNVFDGGRPANTLTEQAAEDSFFGEEHPFDQKDAAEKNSDGLQIVEQDPLKRSQTVGYDNNNSVAFDNHRAELEALKSLTAESRAGFSSEASPALQARPSKAGGAFMARSERRRPCREEKPNSQAIHRSERPGCDPINEH